MAINLFRSADAIAAEETAARIVASATLSGLEDAAPSGTSTALLSADEVILWCSGSRLLSGGCGGYELYVRRLLGAACTAPGKRLPEFPQDEEHECGEGSPHPLRAGERRRAEQ
jgi:hypothetical protein